RFGYLTHRYTHRAEFELGAHRGGLLHLTFAVWEFGCKPLNPRVDQTRKLRCMAGFRKIPLLFSLLVGNFGVETGSQLTAWSANQSCIRLIVKLRMRIALAGFVYPCCDRD